MAPIFRTSLAAVLLLTAGSCLHADDKPPVAPPGYKLVSINKGDHTSYIMVKDAADPLKNINSPTSNKYDPGQLLNHASSMANKSFTADSAAGSNNTFFKRDQNALSNKSYATDTSSMADHSMPHLDTKVKTSSSSAYTHRVAGLDKSFATTSANMGDNKTASLTTSSPYQGRAAILSADKPDSYASASELGSKQYLGPGAQHLPEGVTSNDSYNITRASGLPNRDLSIDEVRNLINNDAPPNTETAPEAPSKPLNDPDYKPEPLRPAPAAEEEKYDAVPAPGTMSAPQPPENTDPLPQH